MTNDDRLWLGGWIAMCLGIADDNLLLKVMAIAMFLLQIYRRRRDHEDTEETS